MVKAILLEFQFPRNKKYHWGRLTETSISSRVSRNIAGLETANPLEALTVSDQKEVAI